MTSAAQGAASYRVNVLRSGSWWAIRIPEIDGAFSQAKRLDQVEAAAREVIALMLDIEESEVGTLDLEVELPPEMAPLLADLRRSDDVARRAATEAAATQRRVAAALHEAGLPMRDVGRLLGVSHQRVSQILSGPARP